MVLDKSVRRINTFIKKLRVYRQAVEDLSPQPQIHLQNFDHKPS